jgi:hypothetical protein
MVESLIGVATAPGPTFTIDIPHNEQMAFYRRLRRDPGLVRPEPRYTGSMACSLRDFIGAIFGELSPYNAMGGLLIDLRERMAELDGPHEKQRRWVMDDLFRAIAQIIEPLQERGVSDAALMPLARQLSAIVQSLIDGSVAETQLDSLTTTCNELLAVGADLDAVTSFYAVLGHVALKEHHTTS